MHKPRSFSRIQAEYFDKLSIRRRPARNDKKARPFDKLRDRTIGYFRVRPFDELRDRT